MNVKIPPSSILIDTCVWLDLAKTPRNEPVVDALAKLIESQALELLMPPQIVAEFARNRDRLVDASKQRLTHELRRVREMIEQCATEDQAKQAIPILDSVHHQLPIFGDRVAGMMEKVEGIMAAARVVPMAVQITERAAERALSKSAPFHRDKK